MRETKKFTTSGGHEVEMYTYASGRDFNAIQQVYLEGAKLQMVGKDVAVDGFAAGADFKAKEKAIELLIVSLDNDKNDVANRVLDLPYQEVEEIQAELDSLTSKKKTA